ncbi:hypothetical protein Rs2_40590 [Raphanus sativus]|nr:hypothetical protein Rs2_40590 [Raphanus sativus]
MSSSSPEDEDCVVDVKFSGPQLSFCRPAQSQPEWTNVKIEDPCFLSSRVIYISKSEPFCVPASSFPGLLLFSTKNLSDYLSKQDKTYITDNGGESKTVGGYSLASYYTSLGLLLFQFQNFGLSLREIRGDGKGS